MSTDPNLSANLGNNTYFNPQGGFELYVKREDIPYLGPFKPIEGREDLPCFTGEEKIPDFKLYNFINNQNVRLAYEREPTNFREKVTDASQKTNRPLTHEIDKCNPLIKDLRSQYVRDGIMRRNKLLLEHIMYERLTRNFNIVDS